MRRSLGPALALLALPAAALGEERFPPPEFSTGYQMPAPTTPPPRAGTLAVLDVVLLAVALSLAAYLVLKRRSRNGVFALMLFSLAYFGFYRNGCVCPIGAIQNVVVAATDRSYALPAVVAAFFALPLLFARFFGRVFCAAVCPMGAVQDVVLARPARIPPWLEHALGLLPYLYLGAAVLFAATGSAFVICNYDPFVSFFRMSGTVKLLSLGAAFLLLSMFVGRPYCRFVCPYGVLLRWVAPWARWPVTITPDTCTQCRLCEESCPFGAIRVPTPEPDPALRHEGRGRLAVLLLLLPVLVAAGGWLGAHGSGRLARAHARVQLADRVWIEEQGKVRGTTDASEAFRKHGHPTEELYREAAELRFRFRDAGRLFGAWVGLVFGLKLILLSIRRRRDNYEADRAACLACARCYRSCPQEHARLGLVIDETEVPDAVDQR